jgi:hypothetical protein
MHLCTLHPCTLHPLHLMPPPKAELTTAAAYMTRRQPWRWR